jgi:hypothetical protein
VAIYKKLIGVFGIVKTVPGKSVSASHRQSVQLSWNESVSALKKHWKERSIGKKLITADNYPE